MLFYIVAFFNIDYRQTYRNLGKHIEGNIKNSLYICKNFVERRPKDVRKMSLDDVHIMTFYERPENITLTHFIKFTTTTFLTYSFRVPPGSKIIEFIQFLINFGETSQGRSNCILK